MQSSRRECHIEDLVGWIGRAAIQAGSQAAGAGRRKRVTRHLKREHGRTRKTRTQSRNHVARLRRHPQSRNTIAVTHDLSDEVHTRAPRTHTHMYMFGLD